MKAEASEARYSTVWATSSGSPTRPSGEIRAIVASARCWPSASCRSVIGVRIQPGATAFTRMAWGPSSVASVLVSCTTAAFATL
nr:hypothetical protein [Streptomyces sp. MW-W600-10]